MKKRVLSLFMALVLCLTLLPAPALAVTDTADAVPQSADNLNDTYETSDDTAIIGSTGYKSLPAALEAAEDGATVKLLADHTTDWDAVNDETAPDYSTLAVVKKTLTLDLNGFSVDYLTVGDETDNEESEETTITASGNLTVMDGGGKGGITGTTNLISGTLIVKGGTFGSAAGGVYSSGGIQLKIGTVTIDGGTVNMTRR